MVQHGRNKKRMSGRAKVSRKQKKPAPLRIANSVVSKEVRDLYDKTKSPAQNLANMGLDPCPNNSRKKIGLTSKTGELLLENKQASAFMGFAQMPESSKFKDINIKRRLMSEVDQKYTKALMTKHSDDYKAMEKDIKLNYNQLTQQKCKSMCEKFLSLDAAQRLVAWD